MVKKDLFIERIPFDNKFCLENIQKAQYIIKPELLSRYFTEKGGTAKLSLWCICQKPDDGRPMLKCDNFDCEIQWYHFQCVQISEVPNTYWLCSTCT